MRTATASIQGGSQRRLQYRTRKRIQRSGQGAAAGPAILAPAGGLTLPRLDGIRQQYVVRDGENAAADLALGLLDLGLADDAGWDPADGSVEGFLSRTVGDWLESAGGGSSSFETFPFQVYLTQSLIEAQGYDREDDNEESSRTRFWIGIYPEATGYVALRHTFDWLEMADPRLPATFYARLVKAANAVFWIFDWDHAEEYLVERHDMWLDEEDEERDRPQPMSNVPAVLKRKPLPEATLKRLLRDRPDERLQSVFRLLDEAIAAGGPIREQGYWPNCLQAELGFDWQPPFPGLLSVIDAHDDTEGVFDDDMFEKSQWGVPVAPTRAWDFDLRSPASVRWAHGSLSAAARVVGLLSDLLQVLPTRDPRALVEVLA